MKPYLIVLILVVIVAVSALALFLYDVLNKPQDSGLIKYEKYEHKEIGPRKPRSIIKRKTSEIKEPKENFSPKVKGKPILPAEIMEEAFFTEEDILVQQEEIKKVIRAREQETKFRKSIDKGGPTSDAQTIPLPFFQPFTSPAGPETSPQSDINNTMPPTGEGAEGFGEMLDGSPNYDGPPIPPGLDVKSLPDFQPVTNKTGPVKKEN